MRDPRAAVQRIVVLIANRENRRLLTELLAPEYEVESELPDEDGIDDGPDLCIVRRTVARCAVETDRRRT